jgi:putative addiction module component (TIGR02574 family)
MNARIKTLEIEARKLTINDRFELVEHILASIDATDPETDEACATEAQDRLAAWRTGEMPSRPATDVFAKHLKS